MCTIGSLLVFLSPLVSCICNPSKVFVWFLSLDHVTRSNCDCYGPHRHIQVHSCPQMPVHFVLFMFWSRMLTMDDGTFGFTRFELLGYNHFYILVCMGWGDCMGPGIIHNSLRGHNSLYLRKWKWSSKRKKKSLGYLFVSFHVHISQFPPNFCSLDFMLLQSTWHLSPVRPKWCFSSPELSAAGFSSSRGARGWKSNLWALFSCLYEREIEFRRVRSTVILHSANIIWYLK